MNFSKKKQMTQTSKSFINSKKQILEKADLSRKGSIDEPIKSLVSYINSLDDFVTTSSCSGRLVIINSEKGDASIKNGCNWQFISHEKVTQSDILPVIMNQKLNLVFVFEPFILHIQCNGEYAAKKMQDCAFAAGFRNSGVMLGAHEKFTVAVRGNQRMEVPLSDDSNLYISEEYLRFLVLQCNEKFQLNEKRTQQFFTEVKDKFKNAERGSEIYRDSE
uniref:tRNA wybutosine-synthesizing protein 3 homolog n=2 Tax=Clastoptera arizonana TaxID=38151 RepID=A0A1B6DQL1_9HEMI